MLQQLYVVIRMAASDFLCPVELFGEDEAHQLMREDEARERPYGIGALMHTVVDPICAADDDENALRGVDLRL